MNLLEAEKRIYYRHRRRSPSAIAASKIATTSGYFGAYSDYS